MKYREMMGVEGKTVLPETWSKPQLEKCFGLLAQKEIKLYI
jgi:hypothetical protein